jgi:diguanylate cyclase (GGDEF)-like protein
MLSDVSPPGGPVAVLVVADEVGEMELLAPSLRARYHLITATSAERAIVALRSHPDLAIVMAAHHPPAVDGARILTEARVLRPECRRVLVADCTGGAEGERILADAVNGCRPHHIENGWPAGEALAQLLDQMSSWFRRRAERRDGHWYRDPLTGLYTHRAFQERLREEMARARRYGKPLSLLYCDVDEFARQSGELGHQAGQAVLHRLAEVLLSPDRAARLRESDIAARFGGQEIAILLPETSKEGAAVKAERVRAAVEQTALSGSRRIRISIGIAGFPDDAGAPADLVARAEQALAVARSAGRNCVRMSPGDEGARAAAGPARRVSLASDRGAPRGERFTTYHVRLFDIVACLRRDRCLACLFVDLSQLRNVERELGPSYHADLVSRAGELLDQMRGDRLRREDLVCRTEDSDGYLCFLASPREGGKGAPIDLEAIASRVEATLERELSAAMTGLTRELPRVVVGFSRVLDNPMVRPERLLVRLVAEAHRSALLHRERATQRHRAFLQEVILRGMLYPVYQPIVDLASGSIFGFEGLARGPRDSTLEAPTALFSVADQVDLTFELDRACFRSALASAAGLDPVHRLFVNLLPTSFYDSSFIEGEVSNLLEAAELTPANLVFEITERLAIENFASFRQALAGYTRAGFGVAIDDVGTRHSNLETVMALRPHFIKLSDVLTRGVSRSTVKREMVRSLQRIAEAIDAVIVAEGIETAEDLAVLGDIGVRYGQGFYLARPGAPFPRLSTSVRRAVRGSARRAAVPTSVAAISTPPPDADEGDFAEPTRPARESLPALDSDLAIGTATHPCEPPDGASAAPWLPLRDELDPGSGTPLISALRRRRAAPADGFFDEETTSGGA